MHIKKSGKTSRNIQKSDRESFDYFCESLNQGFLSNQESWLGSVVQRGDPEASE